MFVAMGLSAVVPVLHGLQIYGLEGMEKRIGLSWLVLQGVLYISGAAIYAVSNRVCILKPLVSTDENAGAHTRKMATRQIRYLGKLAPGIPRSRCTGRCNAPCWIA